MMTPEEAKAYTSEWLPEADTVGLVGWVDGELTAGRLWPCPHCHFLSRTGDPCAVCAHRRDALRELFSSEVTGKDFTKAHRRLLEGREARARAFHEMYLAAYNAATDLIFAAMNIPLKEIRNSL